jgi:hypothetical protein
MNKIILLTPFKDFKESIMKIVVELEFTIKISGSAAHVLITVRG